MFVSRYFLFWDPLYFTFSHQRKKKTEYAKGRRETSFACPLSTLLVTPPRPEKIKQQLQYEYSVTSDQNKNYNKNTKKYMRATLAQIFVRDTFPSTASFVAPTTTTTKRRARITHNTHTGNTQQIMYWGCFGARVPVSPLTLARRRIETRRHGRCERWNYPDGTSPLNEHTTFRQGTAVPQ